MLAWINWSFEKKILNRQESKKKPLNFWLCAAQTEQANETEFGKRIHPLPLPFKEVTCVTCDVFCPIRALTGTCVVPQEGYP